MSLPYSPEQIAAVVSQVLKEKGMINGSGSNGKDQTPGASTPCALPHGISGSGPVEVSNRNVDHVLVKAGADRVGHATEGAEVAGGCAPLSDFIDHTLLKPMATDAQVQEICAQAKQYEFASVCVNPCHVELVAKELTGTSVRVCTVIGFPLGSTTMESKAYETRDAVAKGAHEIDMVINIGKLKSGDFEYVVNDIRAVVEAAQGRLVKVIIETAMLEDEEKTAACILAKAAGANFVKTSTGFGGGGATPEDVALMRKVVGETLGVKASGGIRDCEGAQKLIEAGASRLGASASVAIVQGKTSQSTY